MPFQCPHTGSDEPCMRCDNEMLVAENATLRELAKELWWARRNMAFGPAGEAAVLRQFPWINERRPLGCMDTLTRNGG